MTRMTCLLSAVEGTKEEDEVKPDCREKSLFFQMAYPIMP